MNKIRFILSIIAYMAMSTIAWAQGDGGGTGTAGGASTGSPTIHGNVFGGGRMADVRNTATQTVEDANKVTATIDIYASTIAGGIFGGNDITGKVAQATGDDNASAKITVYDHCDGTCSVKEVYGGGNGYYKYKIGDNTIEIGNITDDNKSTAVNANTLVEVLDGNGTKVAEFYTSEATTYGGLLPSLGNTSVIVGEATDAKNHVALAEVYGGAKNAYVTGTSSVTVNSGTIGKVFAGNNYGGNAQSAILTINGSKKPATEPTKDNFASFNWSKVGDYNDTENGFGIGEAYGGGNAVDVNSRALVYMNDGYVGTLFGGNNLADMSAVPSVHLNGGNLQTVYGGGNAGAMKGCIPGAIDVSQYLDNTLFLAYDNVAPFTSFNNGTNGFSTYCSNNSYLYFYGAETLIEQKNDNVPLRIGTVYGGCRSADVLLSTYVRMTKADYMGNIYGGCDISGSVAKGGLATGTAWVEAAKTYVTAAEMNIEYFDIDNNNPHAILKTLPQGFPIINSASMVTMTGGTTSGNIFAGGNGDYTYTEDGDKVNVYHVGAEQTEANLLATIDKTDYYRPWVANAVAALEGGELLGNLYGGGNDATIGLPAIDGADAVEGRSYVFLGKTARGNQNPTAGPQSAIYAGGKKSDVYGTVDVIVKAGCDLNALYAGNDISGQVEGTNRKNFLTDANPLYTPLYGGGKTYSDQSLLAPYGDASNVVQSYVRVEGANATNNIPAAKIKTLFGGGNGDYDYTTEGSPYYGLTKPTQHSCWLDIKGEVGTSYGGGNAAEVGNSNTYITGDAVVGTAFAGGNSATVTTAANLWLDCDGTRGTQAFVDGSSNTNIPNVGTIFGGNNLADMNVVPKVQLWRGSVQTVYGGGNQGSMKGVRPYMVDLKEYVSGDWFNDNYPLYSSDKVLCFKGTNLVIDSKYEQEADHTPTANPCKLVIGDVYAGCRAANVDNSSYVRVSHCDYIHNVYGGCDIAGSVGMYPGCFPSTSPYRDAAQAGKVKFYHLDSNYAVQEIYKEVPENSPMVNPTSCVLFTGGTVSGNVYGSGNGAYNYVEDGNTVKVYRYGETQDDDHLQASYDKTKMTRPFTTVTTVQIAGGTVEGNVYGGGNMAEVGRIVTAEDVAMHTAVGYTASTVDGKAAYKLFPSWTTTLINGSTTFPEHYVKAGDVISAISNVFLGKSETGRSDVVINGNVYGGGRMADVHGAMDILALHDVTINSLFAGNDISGSVLGTSRVSRFTPNTDYTTLIGDESTEGRKAILNTSFSGKALTADNANTYVRVMPGAKITNLYGGGNGHYYYEVNGGKVDVYALNADGTKDESVSYGSVNATSVEDAKPVQQSTLLDVAGHVTTAYGGGNAANIGTSNLYIVKNAQVETAFAGGNAATVTEEANLYVNCNPALYVEGANTNTTSGHGYIINEPEHTVLTTVSAANLANDKYNVGTLFGGNNIADMAIVPNVQLFHGKIGKAYGGGNQGNMTGVDGFLLGLNTYLNDSWLTSWTDLKQTINGKASGFQMSRFPVFISTNLTLDASSALAGSIPEGYTANTGLRVDELYGGCKAANVYNSSYVRISAADYVGDVYGGCDVAGAVGVGPMNITGSYKAPRDLKCKVYDNVSEKDVYAEEWTFPTSPETGRNYTVKEGTVMRYISTYVTVTAGTIQGKIYGGGNGAYTYTANGDNWDVKAVGSENVLTTIPQSKGMPWVAGANVIIEGGTFNDDIYLGGNAATVGKDYTDESSKPTYYGLDLPGDGNYLALPSHLLIGKSVRTTNASININNDVYCGGRMADVYASVDALVKKDVQINNFYAGNDISGQVNGSRSVYRDVASSPYPEGTDLYGGDQEHPEHTYYYPSTLGNENAPVYVRIEPNAKIGTLFGGGNGEYDYATTYAGLTKPYQKASWLDVRGKIGTVYGGGNAANNGNTAIYIMGEAEIGTTETPGAVYGGCKSADVEHRTQIMMAAFTPKDGTKQLPKVNGNVFGGCDISGNVGMATGHTGRLNIDNALTTDAALGCSRLSILGGTVTGRVFGGGNGLESADGTVKYQTTTLPTILDGTSTPNETYVYADGTYQGKTLPQVENSWLTLEGCTIGTTPGSATHTVFGGGQGAGTRVIHNVDLLVGDGTDGSTVQTIIKGISYGGSYAGFVNTDCDDHTRTMLLGYGSNTQVQGDIYGGSYGNYVRGKIQVDINNIKVGVDENAAGIYAGNNSAGQPECEASINFVGNDCNVALYGGGNEAPFYGTTRITFTTGSVGYIYGGGNHAPVYGNTIVEVLGGHVCHDVFGGGNEGGVFKWKSSAEHPTPDGKDYGGNTLVIVRDDCLQLGTDSAGKNPGDTGYSPTFKTDALTGNHFANRGTTSYFNIYNADGSIAQTVDPYTAGKHLYILKPNGNTPESCKKSTIKIEGNVFGGGNAADVEGKATVIVGNKD